MNTEALVSMITYCYNGERFVSKYFDAILAQNYSNIELIFFNNGSEDRTGEIAESYRERLENKGVKVNIIHYKENQSTCKLKQDAFQMMTGEYFFGCDSDDYIDPDYIKEMSEYLTANPEKGIVYCQLRMVNESTNEVIKIMKMIPRKESKKAFEDFSDGICYPVVNGMWLFIFRLDIECIYVVKSRMIVGEINKISMINNTMLCNK